MWATLRQLFWTTELEQGTEVTIEEQSPHLPTHTPEIIAWLGRAEAEGVNLERA